MVRRFIADLLGTGRHTSATVRKVGQILTKVMRSSVETGLIARSPCDGVRLPAEGRREMRLLTAEQVSKLAAAVEPEWETLVYTAAYAGLRWGQLAGLRPARVKLARRTILVVEQLNELNGRLDCGPPKKAAGCRAVSIPSALAGQLARPMVARSGLVFPTPLGEPMKRSNFARRVWSPATKAFELDGLRFHDLRHSSVTVTLDRYGHLSDGLDAQVADSLDSLMRTAREAG